jgi:Ca-activated chloride channel family protein
MDPAKGGFFTLALIPPKAPTAKQIAPREVYFVIDQSGSQNGFPIDKSKELTLKLIKTMRPGDTFNVLGFANSVTYLWPTARAATPENMAVAEQFITPLQANGGTELLKAVVAALGNQNDRTRLRMVLFNSDGFVGNENEILDTIQKNRGSARMFTFGIGNSVNRTLIDSMSVEGQGDAEYVTLAENADTAVQRFQNRLQTPVLTHVSVRTEGCGAGELLPAQMPDVFNGKPIVVYGRYSTAGPGKIVISGQLGSEPWSQTVDVNFGAGPSAPAVESLWARRRVDDLVRSNWRREFRGEGVNPQIEKITQTALDFNIMSDYTSFVAVEPRVVNVGGKSRTIRVPVEMADGVSYAAYDEVGGVAVDRRLGLNLNVPLGRSRAQSSGLSSGGLIGGGRGGGGATFAGSAKPTWHGTMQMDTKDKDFAGHAVLPSDKISAKLKRAKGKVEVQVLVKSISPELLAKLEKAGLKIEGKDHTLGAIFGTCDAKVLEDIAKLELVQRIEPLE